VPLSFPSPFRREFGIGNARGLTAERALHAIYQAHRVRQLTAAVRDPSVIEIGAGVGRTAYYAHAFGVRDYTIVDLPLTLVGQTLFLTATLGPQAIWLWGEPEPANRDVIKLCPPAFVERTRKQFHLALNVDSLTEMDRSHAENYIVFAREHCDGLLSINHEANAFAVSDLAPPPSYRFPYALRPGYAEEFYPSPPRWGRQADALLRLVSRSARDRRARK